MPASGPPKTITSQSGGSQSVQPSPPARQDSDPWPHAEDAIRFAAFVAEQAREFYGEGLEEVWMYGSRARGDHQPDSDLDLVLVRRSPRGDDPIGDWRDDWRFKEGLEQYLGWYRGFLLSLHTARPEQFRTWDTTFYRNVRKDAVQIL